MKYIKPLLYIIIPLLCAAAVGRYFGYCHYLKELKDGNDPSDAFQWAFFAGLFLSVIGLLGGLVIDLFIWLITNSPRIENDK